MRSPQRPHNRRRSTDARNPEYELTSLNSTLNRFVGGRQKSWMLNHNSTPKTSVPPAAKRPIPAPTSKPKPPIPILLPRNSEKDKEKPTTLESGSGRSPKNTNTQDQNGSIAPSSEQLPISPVSLACSIQPAPASPSTSPHIFNSQLAQTSINAPTNDRQFTVLPSPDSSHGCSTRAASEAGPQGDSSIPGAVPFPLHRPACPPLSGAELQPRNPSSTATDGIGHSPLPISQTPSIARNSPTLEVHRDKRPRIVSGNSALPQPHRPQNTVPTNTQSTSDMMNNNQAILKLLLANPFSLKPFVSLLDRCSTQPGNFENSRISLLRNACEEEDLFYVVLHQVYCLSTTCPGLLDPSKFGPRQIAGLEIVSHLLIKNHRLSMRFVQACAKFPALFRDLRQHCPIYSNVLEEVIAFLEAMANRWMPFETSVASRGYPPLIDELIAVLGLTSPIFQHIIFVACCRRFTGARNDSLIQIYTGIFRKNQEFYRQRLLRMHSANPVPLPQMHIENEILLEQYQQIWEKHVLPNRKLHNGAVHNQPPQQNQRASFPIANAGGPPAQTQGSITQGSQQPPIQHAYHQVRSSYPTLAPNTTQHPTQLYQQYASAPSPNRMRATAHSHTLARAAAAAAAGRSMMAQPHSNSILPMSPQFALPPNNVNTHLHHGAFVHPSVQPAQTNGTTTQSLYPKPTNLLLPPPGFVPMESVNPNPRIVGLHQAYLKEKVMSLDSKESGSGGPPRLFQYLQNFIIPPSSIRTHTPILKWQFTIPPGEFQKLPVQLNAAKHSSRVWGVSDGRRTYQLRCIKMDPPFPKLAEHQWAVSDTAWPTAIYIHVNGTEHFVRRKVHNGRDIPLHVTSSLKQGLNEVSLTILWGAAELSSKSTYGMALEVLEYAAPSRVRSSIQHLQSSASLDQIKKRLTGLNADDDDIAVVDEHITIDLVDPFMARVFDTPTRGKFCSHIECFDLETFLMTRLSRSVKGYGMAEDWKCPICSNDARPQSLIIDDFLVTVRRKLEEDKQSDVKAILVRPDGSWEPKTERNNNRSSEPRLLKRKRETSEDDGITSLKIQSQQLPPSLPSKESSAPEIIELD
ncbi:hypothetical protein GX50_03330 [[Emmonsia] crescens]|uniref:SP-RING-type domain-containing protein n=1 Tax=[Emmonsia] crescens TaxID=73230 RepID=A0A2B7ZKH3_9EURO|nr:hypothetical protein GX50_03330 [Emmonsia crescens]